MLSEFCLLEIRSFTNLSVCVQTDDNASDDEKAGDEDQGALRACVHVCTNQNLLSFWHLNLFLMILTFPLTALLFVLADGLKLRYEGKGVLDGRGSVMVASASGFDVQFRRRSRQNFGGM